ncbi:hypothetical protein GOV08_05265 [Candidatus Woesearchaeota archaeon]|nr:hypothetical protein [Candidatus Woesearchaeota archaeon]
MKKIILILLVILISLSGVSIAASSDAVIYYNEACGMCQGYLGDMKAQLSKNGVDSIIVKDYVNLKEYRKELLGINDRHGIPPTLQAHMVTIVDDKYFFEGHVPLSLVDEALSQETPILLYQDKMDKGDYYLAWGFRGDAKKYEIDLPLSEYLGWFEQNKESLNPPEIREEYTFKKLFPIVLTTGLLAGIHPCTIAVLLFFLAFMFTIQATRLKTFKIGLSYILGIFAAFTLIGLGIFKAIIFTKPHFFAKLAGIAVIILGLFNIYQYFFKTKINLGLPKASKKKVAELVQKSSVPASFVLGLLVGTCSFGCTAGIYFSILALIATQTTKGVFYLMTYNLMFILPLIVILIVSSNKQAVKKMQQWQRSESKIIKLIGGIVMVLIGLYLLI